jgi:hypothetical protein
MAYSVVALYELMKDPESKGLKFIRTSLAVRLTERQVARILGLIATAGPFHAICGMQILRQNSVACGEKSHISSLQTMHSTNFSNMGAVRI